MASKDAPTPDIMNVKELIEFAFGDFEKNTVNFKLVQTVLFLLARQLRLLERRVIVETGPLTILPSDTTLSVTEVKIHAVQKTQTKKGGAKHGAAGQKSEGGAVAGVGTGDGAKSKKTGRGTPSDKTSTDKKTFADKTDSGKTTSSGEKTYTDRTTSSGEKTYTDRTSLSDGKDSPDRRTTSSREKSSSDRTILSGEKTYTDKTTASDGQTFTDRTTLSSEKTSTDKKTTAPGGNFATDRTSASDGKTSTDRTTLSGDKTSTDKTTAPDGNSATDKTSASAGKISTGRTTSSGEKTSTDKTTSSGGKTSTNRTTSSGDKTSPYKKAASAGKTSTDRTTSSGKKTFTGETTSISTDKPSSKTTLSGRTSTSRTTLSSKDAARRQKPDSYPDTLDTLEEQRERELRIIHQRTDSFEETIKTPTPMASVSSMQYEKLLVVKKVPSSETRLGESMQRRTPQISVVTQEQFQQVADAVRHLEKKLLPIGTPGFPEHAELMEELRRGASLTDAMAALQLSARLEATEKALTNLMSMVTDLALKTPGVEIDSQTGEVLGISTARQRDSDAPEPGEVFEGDRIESDHIEGDPIKDEPSKGDPFEIEPFPDDPFEGGRSATTATDAKESKSMNTQTETAIASSETAEIEMTLNTASGTAHVVGPSPAPAPEATHTDLIQSRFISHVDLQHGSKEMYDEMINKLKTMTTRTSTTADNAYKLSVKLERRLESALLDTSRMVDLENTVKQYAEQINALDTGLSSQMTNYQEQLTQMQHDLEIGLDTMAEVLGNSGGDTDAVAELHSRFTNLQADFESISFRQQELKGAQNSTAYDLENLWREIEMLRDLKSDREEVADALRDKAGISELNGLVSVLQFEAVRADFQKRIRAAYDKFNNQEIIWQKAIDDTVKVLNEKADLVQLYSLKDEIHKYLNRIKERMQTILDVVGEPKSAMLSKKVFRDTLCLSCGSPAHMDVEETVKVPALPKFPSARQPAEGAEAESETKGSGDYGPCYPGLPIPHPRDPRSHICKRYCGGSHTVVTDGLNRALPGLVVQQAQRPSNTEPGTDGKLYLMDEETKKIPCLPCNVTQPLPTALEPEPQKQAPMDSIDEFENISLTPPAHEISNN